MHRANVDDLEPLFNGIEPSIRITLVDRGVFAVIAPYHQKLRLPQLPRSRIRSLSVLRTAYGHQAREHALRVANSTVHIVRTAMHIQKTTPHRAEDCVELGREHAVRLRSVLFLLLKQLTGNSIHGLIPAATLKLAFALFANTLHRIQNAAGSIEHRHSRIPFCAEAATTSTPVVSRLGVSFNIRPAAILDVAQCGTVRTSGTAHLAPSVAHFHLARCNACLAGGARLERFLARAAGERRHRAQGGRALQKRAPRQLSLLFHALPPVLRLINSPVLPPHEPLASKCDCSHPMSLWRMHNGKSARRYTGHGRRVRLFSVLIRRSDAIDGLVDHPHKTNSSEPSPALLVV